MNIRYYFQNLNDDCKNGAEKYFSQKKISQIEKLLNPQELELAQLTIRVKHFKKHNAFSAKAELAYGKEVLLGEEQSHDVLKALDFSIKRLTSQLKS